ncbi:hypothetical protein [Leptospira terpstrae]|uniref:Uncharacterized protein n=1 Tax=Leptospira terpstrae serovar Hualin str. LT 11-33 = ATCC 700639 TaxID=1257025 RepID=N1VR87_9LEPT|nr:hypothetical protein [Leptospira terpstrae]EMY60968.1 hypothetical protein LEP1GSC203_1098 [Leptospira terpstrae serovar Hualin str. LT 11-33 = ATCC 700639]
MEEETLKKEIRKEILLKFNEQFAINQNTQLTSVYSFLAIIAPVLLGFGYVTNNFERTIKGVISIQFLDYAAVYFISNLILLAFISLLSSYSASFRRDQLIVSNIREFSKLQGSTAIPKIFPERFSPKKAHNDDEVKIHQLNWMPNYYAALVRIVLIIEIFISLAYSTKLFQNNYRINICNAQWGESIISLLGILLIFMSFIIPSYYNYFLVTKYYNQNIDSYENKDYTLPCYLIPIFWIIKKLP